MPSGVKYDRCEYFANYAPFTTIHYFFPQNSFKIEQ